MARIAACWGGTPGARRWRPAPPTGRTTSAFASRPASRGSQRAQAMALEIAPKPEAALALVTRELADMAMADRFLTPRLRAARLQSLAVSTWLPCYRLVLD